MYDLTPAGPEFTQRLFIDGRHTLAPAIGRLTLEQPEQLLGLLEVLLETAGDD